MTTQDPWQKVLEIISEQLNPISFSTWFKPIEIMSMNDERMVLGINDSTGVQVLRQRYNLMLAAAVRDAYGRDYDIIVINSRDPVPPVKEDENNPDQLNPRYTFDTFVVGQSNRFAHAASLAVAELPAFAYNPLFLYGGVGLGKTHLMHAIGHYLIEDDDTRKIMYITSERFTNHVIEAIQNKNTAEMREKMRGVDVLMVDDIQFIAGKTSTQEEFFHTFNHLHSCGKQIVISSDRPPKEIPTLEERLRSRFEWGLIADIQKPDYETRVAILRKKAGIEHMDMPDEVIHYIAENVQSNIRELEGMLIRVNAQSMLGDIPITLDMAVQALSTIGGARAAKAITPEKIIQIVADYYRIDKDDMLSSKRNREIAMPRQVAMYMMRELTTMSTTRIGEAFGGRDHTTVMHGVDKISRTAREIPSLEKALDEIRSAIRNSN
ncbi:MAG: chromosomal replication initiator protein DnaA [Clostridia bacterium]|nr:chromosomal replication initiator protein DnaA [Clostridia bacterium]